MTGTGNLEFVPVPSIVTEDACGIASFLEQEASGLVHIVKGEKNLAAIDRQHWMVRHHDFFAYPSCEHSGAKSTIRAGSCTVLKIRMVKT